MYQGKNKSRIRSGKSMAVLVSLFLLLTATVGGTIAFLMDSAGPLNNLFIPAQVTTKVEEDVSGNKKSNVKIQNTGNTDAWIRADVVVTWQDASGNVYGQMPVACEESTCNHESCGKDYTISYKISDKIEEKCWVEGSDGFYYWTSPVEANKLTENLIDTCTALKSITVGTGSEAVTYYLTVEIIGSGIQSKPAKVFNDEWKNSGLKVDDSNADPMQWTLVETSSTNN